MTYPVDNVVFQRMTERSMTNVVEENCKQYRLFFRFRNFVSPYGEWWQLPLTSSAWLQLHDENVYGGLPGIPNGLDPVV